LAFANRTQLLRELVRELGEPLLPCVHQLELSLSERNRCSGDPCTLVVVSALRPLVPQASAGLLGFRELHELVERQPEQVAKTDQLLQARDVGVGVEPVCTLCALVPRSEQTELFVVADRARGDPGSLGHLADPVAALLHVRAHPVPSVTWRAGTADVSGSTGSRPISAGDVAST
jgi:hypothetical protein